MLSKEQRDKGINVLSLCDGISCGKLALERAGIKIKRYIRAEIDKNANFVSYKNNPGVLNIGDVLKVRVHTDESRSTIFYEGNDCVAVLDSPIDLVIFGSECQSFSLQGEQLGFTSLSGQVMLECIRIYKESKAPFFLCENVRMKPIYKEAISELIGVKPYALNSVNFGGIQSRNRLYWTNIPLLDKSELMEPKNIQDVIIGEGFPMTCRKGKNGNPRSINRMPHFGCATKSYWKGIRADGRPAIGTVEQGWFDDHYPNNIRQLTPVEFERLQSLPDGYTEGVSKTNRYQLVGNGWHIDTVAHIFKGLLKQKHEKI